MSILQEYAKIRSRLRTGEFEAIERYLALNPVLFLSDIYYNQDEYKKFDAWWEEEKKQKKEYAFYLKQWEQDHEGSEFYGMEPVCFEEFLDNEYQYEEGDE